MKVLNYNFNNEQYMLPEDDRVIEICRSVLNVLMYILDFSNNIYIYMRLRWSRGSVLAFSTQVRGFKPDRSRRIFRAKKS